VTLTDPDDVKLGAVIVGPGIDVTDNGDGDGRDGDTAGTGETGVGDSPGETISYRLINFQVVYVFSPVESSTGYSASVARASQPRAANARAHTSGLVAAMRTNSPPCC